MKRINYRIKIRNVRGFFKKQVYKPHIVKAKPCLQKELIESIKLRVGYKIAPSVFSALTDVILSNALNGRDTYVPHLGTFSILVKPKSKEIPHFVRADFGKISIKFILCKEASDLLNDQNIVFCKMP